MSLFDKKPVIRGREWSKWPAQPAVATTEVHIKAERAATEPRPRPTTVDILASLGNPKPWQAPAEDHDVYRSFVGVSAN